MGGIRTGWGHCIFLGPDGKQMPMHEILLQQIPLLEYIFIGGSEST